MKKLVLKQKEIRKKVNPVSFGRCLCGNPLTLPVFVLNLYEGGTIEVCGRCYMANVKELENYIYNVEQRV